MKIRRFGVRFASLGEIKFKMLHRKESGYSECKRIF